MVLRVPNAKELLYHAGRGRELLWSEMVGLGLCEMIQENRPLEAWIWHITLFPVLNERAEGNFRETRICCPPRLATSNLRVSFFIEMTAEGFGPGSRGDIYIFQCSLLLNISARVQQRRARARR